MSYQQLPHDIQQLQLQNPKPSTSKAEEEMNLPIEINLEENVEEIQTTCVEEAPEPIMETPPEPMEICSNSTLDEASSTYDQAITNAISNDPQRFEAVEDNEMAGTSSLDWQVSPPKKRMHLGASTSAGVLEILSAPRKLTDPNERPRAATWEASRLRKRGAASKLSMRTGGPFRSLDSAQRRMSAGDSSSGAGGNARSVARRLFQTSGNYQTIIIDKCPECKMFGFDVVARDYSWQGPIGIVIKAIFTSTETTDENCFKEGDEITSINGVLCQNLPHKEAAELLKNVVTGPVSIRIYRCVDANEHLTTEL